MSELKKNEGDLILHYRVVQTTPAVGWVVRYNPDEGEKKEDLDDAVVCFALIEYKDKTGDILTEVHPMVATNCGIEVEFASNFDKVVYWPDRLEALARLR